MTHDVKALRAITPEMQLAWVEYEPPSASEVPEGQTYGAIKYQRHAFYSGWFAAIEAALSEKQVSPSVSDVKPWHLGDFNAGEVEEEARRLYDESTANDPVIHCNRFPSWRELPEMERRKWREMARRLEGNRT